MPDDESVLHFIVQRSDGRRAEHGELHIAILLPTLLAIPSFGYPQLRWPARSLIQGLSAPSARSTMSLPPLGFFSLQLFISSSANAFTREAEMSAASAEAVLLSARVLLR